MAQIISNYLANLWLDQWFGQNQSPTIPGTFGVSLWTTSPGPGNSGGVEVSTVGTNYFRLALLNNATVFSAASNRTKTNIVGTIPWFTAGAAFGPIVAVCLFDSTTVGAGNLLLLNEIPSGSQQSAVAGNTIGFSINDLLLTL